ncbi:hypothetical protein CFC21_068407, partial [Triticum aestivum]
GPKMYKITWAMQ